MAARRNVAVLAASVFGMALGEELWQAYLPAYLTALGASGIVVGLFSSFKDLLDSAYQYPGGWLADRVGPRRALQIFTALAIAGYATYAVASSWPVVFAGLLGVMAWKAGAFPTTFAVIGSSLPPDRRAVAFGVQSVLVRVPRVIGGATRRPADCGPRNYRGCSSRAARDARAGYGGLGPPAIRLSRRS